MFLNLFWKQRQPPKFAQKLWSDHQKVENFAKLVNFDRFGANAFHNTTLTHQKWWFTAILGNWRLPNIVQKGVSLGAVVKGKSDSTRFFTTRKFIYLPIRPPSRGGSLEPCHMGKKILPPPKNWIYSGYANLDHFWTFFFIFCKSRSKQKPFEKVFRKRFSQPSFWSKLPKRNDFQKEWKRWWFSSFFKTFSKGFCFERFLKNKNSFKAKTQG